MWAGAYVLGSIGPTERMIEMTQPRGEKVPGITSPTAERAPYRVDAPVIVLDLSQQVEQLHAEEAWRAGDRNTKTLVHHPDLRAVLLALKAGARINQHQAAGRITIQTLTGAIRVQLEETAHELRAGQMLSLDREIRHDVEALEESAFLLTIAWPVEKHSP
jgi:quercetin dioxygenase-like cupin family protein